MKQISKSRNIVAVFALTAVMLLSMLALSPEAFAATEITTTDGTNVYTTNSTIGFPYPMQQDMVWTDANTLTLTDYNPADNNYSISIIGDITIVLNGTNVITSPTTGQSALHVDGNLTFTGSGSLTVDGFDSSGSESPTTAIDCTGTITFNGPSITANGGSYNNSGGGHSGALGVKAGGIIVSAGVVKIQGGETNAAAESGGDGLSLTGAATINGGKVDIWGGNGNGGGANGGDGISGGSVIINDGEVDIKGGSANNISSFGGHGIHFSNVTISGGTSVTIQGGTGHHLDGGNGVTGNVTISTTATIIEITGGESRNGSASNQIGNGGDGVAGNVITPTGTIGGSTNITMTGGNGGVANGEPYSGSILQFIPTPTPTPTPAPTPTPSTGTTETYNPALSPQTGVYTH